jgi:hypothetical protein
MPFSATIDAGPGLARVPVCLACVRGFVKKEDPSQGKTFQKEKKTDYQVVHCGRAISPWLQAGVLP